VITRDWAEVTKAGVPSPAFATLGESSVLVWFGGIAPGTSPPFIPVLALYCREAGRGVVEVVPGASSLLLQFTGDVEDPLEVARALVLDGSENSRERISTQHHEIPVNYSREHALDLEATARLHRSQPETIVRLHRERIYRVGFLGFLPGFAYMGPTPLQIAIKRRSSPRTAVPAGSVGLAGRYTGIYPFASPGGWNVIGRTSVSLWNPGRKNPALLEAGDTVQFVATDESPVADALAQDPPQPGYPLFRVEGTGGPSVVQDRGWQGYAHLGLGRGGASDELAAGRANSLVGNTAGAAVLEMYRKGPSLRVLRGTLIALEGADLGCRVDGLMVPVGVSWYVRAGSLISFQQSAPSQSGAYGFLAVPGGFDVPQVLGSRSTSLVAQMGGFGGRPLRIGDVLGVPAEPPLGPMQAGRFWMPRPDEDRSQEHTLRLIPYGGPGKAPKKCLRALYQQVWKVDAEANRVGIRLRPGDGIPILAHQRGVPSFGVVRGTVQLPPSGEPIILGADSGTTGGYPVLGVVARADWPVLAQLVPGESVRFHEISHMEANAAWRRQDREHKAGLNRLGAK
jgi:KipI family sensor histidine kinase inhibitor